MLKVFALKLSNLFLSLPPIKYKQTTLLFVYTDTEASLGSKRRPSL